MDATFFLGVLLVPPIVAIAISLWRAYDDTHPYPHWRD